MFGINTYVVSDPVTGDCAIIDPGMSDSEEEEALDSYITRNKLKVTHIINTHLHIDHSVGIRHAAGKYNAPVLGHKDDSELGKRLESQAQMFGLNMKVGGVELTSYLSDGDVVHVGDGELKVLHVPGHSQGSIALYDPAGHYVITGDALFNGSIGRTDLPGGNYQQLISSVRNKLMSLPDDTVVYPGHGPETTIGHEKVYNPYVH